MIEVVRNDKGDITAICEYLIFNNLGGLDEEGNKIFIGDVEINPEHQRKSILRHFIKVLLVKYPKLEQCYFYRKKKYPYRDYRTWTRAKLELLTKE
jgi:hypothetical protein